jgi:translation initiation factor 2 beta subunit (eIF-2beta)/eIF-5
MGLILGNGKVDIYCVLHAFNVAFVLCQHCEIRETGFREEKRVAQITLPESGSAGIQSQVLSLLQAAMQTKG